MSNRKHTSGKGHDVEMQMLHKTPSRSHKLPYFVGISLASMAILGTLIVRAEQSLIPPISSADYIKVESRAWSMEDEMAQAVSTDNETVTAVAAAADSSIEAELPIVQSDANLLYQWLHENQRTSAHCGDKSRTKYSWHPKPQDKLGEFLQSWKHALLYTLAHDGLLVSNEVLLNHPVARGLWFNTDIPLLPRLPSCSEEDHLIHKEYSTTHSEIHSNTTGVKQSPVELAIPETKLVPDDVLHCAILSSRVLSQKLNFERPKPLIWFHRKVMKFLIEPSTVVMKRIEQELQAIEVPSWMSRTDSVQKQVTMSVHVSRNFNNSPKKLVSGRTDFRLTARDYFTKITEVVGMKVEWRGVTRVLLWNDLSDAIPMAAGDLQWAIRSLPAKTSAFVVNLPPKMVFASRQTETAVATHEKFVNGSFTAKEETNLKEETILDESNFIDNMGDHIVELQDKLLSSSEEANVEPSSVKQEEEFMQMDDQETNTDFRRLSEVDVLHFNLDQKNTTNAAASPDSSTTVQEEVLSPNGTLVTQSNSFSATTLPPTQMVDKVSDPVERYLPSMVAHDFYRLLKMSSADIILGASDSPLARTIAELVVPDRDQDCSLQVYDTLQRPYFSCTPSNV